MHEGICYRENTASTEELLRHLQACDATYVPPLSARAALPEYASKLVAHAMRVEAWEGSSLTGLAAFYCNRPPLAFLSNLSVLPGHRRRGIAAELLGQCMTQAAAAGCASMQLMLGQGNAAAFALYRRHGFAVAAETDGILTMSCSLQRKHDPRLQP